MNDEEISMLCKFTQFAQDYSLHNLLVFKIYTVKKNETFKVILKIS